MIFFLHPFSTINKPLYTLMNSQSTQSKAFMNLCSDFYDHNITINYILYFNTIICKDVILMSSCQVNALMKKLGKNGSLSSSGRDSCTVGMCKKRKKSPATSFFLFQMPSFPENLGWHDSCDSRGVRNFFMLFKWRTETERFFREYEDSLRVRV